MIRIDDMPYMEEISTQKAIATQGSSGGSLSFFGVANGENGYVDVNADLSVVELSNDGSISTGYTNVVGFASDPDGASVAVGTSGTASGDHSYVVSISTSYSNGTVAYGTSTTTFYSYTSP